MNTADTANESTPVINRHVHSGTVCCDPAWEDAYKRFESPEEEISKFIKRLHLLGLENRPRDIRVAELFCGRGGGLTALKRLGFTRIEGVDLSETLLLQNQTGATLHLADCRDLPFEDASLDAVIIHGGLHHLPNLPKDLEQVLSEIHRVLNTDGTFHAVEPWLTPFLRFVHAVIEIPAVRRCYAKGDALAVMIQHERETYEQWLSQPAPIRELLGKYFTAKMNRTAWGKIQFTGLKRRVLH
ncbi:MAG TPA: class I SAM-dependent methyltransferase [Rhodopirellula sp.]|nr:class I SAM-dependent methyltransferase [Rhodopirellula sp.]